jgi:hypothetical protein
MPKNNVIDLITDQEMAFGRLVLSGTMTDYAAAQAGGLNPETAAYTKASPIHPHLSPQKGQKHRILSNFTKRAEMKGPAAP